MIFEALLVLFGIFFLLAFGFWKAAERPKRADSEPLPSRTPELHKSV